MKNTLFKNKLSLFSFLLLSLFATESMAQNTGWQWAKSGGGTKSSGNESANSYSRTVEQILDIKTDADNNYYYMAIVTSGNSQIDGIPITTYNYNPLNGSTNSNTDILLFSTTADGTYRWHRVIGGTNVEYAWNIQLDDENGIYVGANTFSAGSVTSGRLPTRFSEDDILPYVDASNTAPQYGYKTSFLLKYDTANGDLVWRKDIQGDVTSNKRQSYISQLQIDSSNTIHAIVGLREGTHLDGQVVIPPSDNEEIILTYYLVKYDTSGTLTEPPVLLPVTAGGFVASETFFRYDETLNRYYLAGSRKPHPGTSYLTDLAYNNIPFTQDGYILAIDAETLTELWRKEMIASYDYSSRNIRGIEIEDGSGIYLGGRFYNSSTTPGVSFNDYVLNNELTGYIPVIIKLDSDGNVLWHKIPDGYTNNAASTGTYHGFGVTVNGNEVAFATHSNAHIWGNFQIERPMNHRTDPLLIRLNKQTGSVIGLNDVMGSTGVDGGFTTVTVDNDGAYVLGGYFVGVFMDNPNAIPALISPNSYTDFFYTKLTVDTTSSNKDFNSIKVNVYPNPTADILNIETQETLSVYTVYDNHGRKVQSGLFGNDNQINLQNQATGIYFVKVNTVQGNTATVKVVKR